MKKMNLKRIFNWLYAKMLDRAMSERRPREERETISPVYRLVSVSYLSAFLSSMCSQWGLLALARRIYSSKDNSVCLSRCGWSASRTMLVALLLLFVGGWNSEAWAWDGTYTVTAKSRPTAGGYVSNNNNFSGKSTEITAKGTCSAAWNKSATAQTTVYAQAVPGYTFTGWSTKEDGSNIVSRNSSYTSTSESMNLVSQSKSATYYAIFTPTYTIVFNGNGNTSGSMSDLSMVYGTAQSLTDNEFQKQYTVTYNADGGSCATTSSTVTYTFSGWEDRNSIIFNGTTYAYTTFDAPYYANTYSDLYAYFGYNKYNLIQHYVNNGKGESRSCKGATPGLYPNQASVNNLTTTAGATVTLYAHWDCVNPSVTLPSATKSGKVLDGWYSGNTKIGDPEDTYTPTADIALTAKWISKYDFEITGGNYTINNEAWNKTEAFTFVHADEKHMTTTIQNPDVISYDRASNTITAKKIGTSKITFTQNTSTTVNNGTIEWTITVDSVANNLTVSGTSFKRYVEQEVTSVRSNQNSDGTITTTSSNPNLAHYDIANNKIVIPNSAAQKLPFNDVTITISQAATAKYKAKKHTITLKVEKYANTIKVKNSTNYSSSIYVDSYDNKLTLTADNTDYTNCPITNKQTAGKDIATFYQNDEVVYSSYKLGTATWTLSQPENYKYQAGSGSFTVTVAKAAEAADCYVLNYPGEKDFGTYGPTSSYEVNGPADKLYFKAKKNGYNYFVAEYSTDNGSSWHEICAPDLTGDYPTNDYGPFTIPEKNITHIRFGAKFGATLHKWVKDVKITRKTWLNTSVNALTIDSTATKNPIYPSDGKGTKTLTIDYSLANGGDLHIANDNSKFTLDKTTISNVDCKTGTATINISYESDEAGTDVAHLVIYNKVYRKEVTVTGITAKRNQVVNWEVGNVIRLNSEIEDVAWVITGNTVSYESLNPSVIAVVDGKLVAQSVGSAEIVARADGSGDYKDAYDKKTIEVTNDLIQSIVWTQDQDLLRMNTTTRTSLLLDAYATSDVEGCTTNGARPITYASSNKSVVRIEGTNRLVVVGVGRATVTATQDGSSTDADGHKYMTVSEAKIVVVRDPNAPCINYQYQQGEEKKEDFGISMLNPQEKDVIKQTNLVEPDSLILEYRGEAKHWGLGDYYNGNMTVNEFYDNRWHLVDGGNLGTPPSDGSYGTFKARLNRKTTEVSVHVTEGRGYHMVKGMKIGIARYIESGNELSVFESKVGQQVSQKLTINYSNIVGPITLQLGHAQSNFSLSQTLISGECGDKDTKEITVYYTPSKAMSQEMELLTISDGVTSLQIPLEAQATVTQRYVSWDIEEHTNVYTVETVNLTAQALATVGNTPAGSVYYSKDGTESTTGNLSGSTLTFSNAGVAKITAMATADAKYNTPTGVTKFYHAALTPTTISTLPTLQGTVYGGTAAEDVMLTGGVAINTVNSGTVKGTFEVISPTTLNAGTYALTVRFTPEDENMYTGCTATLENVTIAQRTPEESELGVNVGTIIYGQRIDEASLANTGSLDGRWYWKDEDANKKVKAVGTYDNLNVYFVPKNTNYATVYSTVSVTVKKATPVVTAQASAITYGQAISASKLTTATGNINGTWAWAVNETQVLSVGNHALKANFTSTNANYSDLSNVDVTLKVNKIEKLGVPVALSFCAGESVNFHGNTYSEAGEYKIEAEGATRDTVYNVTVTKLQPTTGTDSKTITVGASESWNGINLSGYAVGSHEVEFHTTNAAGCDSTVTLALTVVPATNIFTNEAGDGDWRDPANWSNGVPFGSEPNVIINGDLIIDSVLTVGNLTIEKNSRVVLTVNGDLTVNGTSESREEYGNLYVENGGEVEVNGGLRVGDLTVEASIGTSDGTAESGQVDKAENIVYANAYIEINMDARGTLDDTKWYGFTVPFDVDARTGISRKENGVYRQCTYGTHYMIAEYDANKRLTTGKGWKYITGNTLHAGTFYYLTVDGNYNTYRFKAKEATYTQASPATLAMNGSTSDPNANWNAVGNSTLQHAKVSFNGGNYVQVYENGLDAYRTVSASEATFVVGCPFFIQATEASTVVLDAPTSATKYYYAPRRSSAAQGGVARVNLTSVEGGYSDQIYVSGTEKEEDAYIAGRDLAKAGESKVVPQLWVDAYNQKLSVHEAAWQGENAICPLGIYAPKDGEYILTATQPENGTQVYLTIDGMPVWNISEADYVLSLEKGTMNNYGLMLVQAFKLPTDVENVEAADGEKTQKIILNDHLYILRDSRMYDVTGKKVK